MRTLIFHLEYHRFIEGRHFFSHVKRQNVLRIGIVLILFLVCAPKTLSQIIVDEPFESQTWFVGSKEFVEWSSSAALPGFIIRLSTDGGNSFPLVLSPVDVDTDNGECDIVVPNSPSTSCRLKVESSVDTSIFGLNPGLFKIYPFPVLPEPSPILFSNVIAGTTRTVLPMSRGATDSIGRMTLAGMESSRVLISLVLPAELTNFNQERLFMSYSERSGAFLRGNLPRVLFDPAIPDTGVIDSTGFLSFVVGGTVTVPQTAHRGVYQGSILVTASNVGSGKDQPTRRLVLPQTDCWQSCIDITASVTATEAPDVVLQQNYPNPSNPSTKFSFILYVPSTVILTVYDILGRTVASPVHEALAPGAYVRGWDATSISNGVYFYRIEAGSSQSTKRLLILK